jgi:hypothetical protein
MTIETVWVSFADETKFRGVAIVDVDINENAITGKNATGRRHRGKLEKWALLAVERTIEMNCNAGPDTSVKIQRTGGFIDCDHKNMLILDKALLDRIKAIPKKGKTK